MDLDLTELRSFVVLLEEGHFGRAARRLHVGSSGLTKRIQHLERRLGVVLLERGPEGVVGPTAAGQCLAELAPALLLHAYTAAQSVAPDKDESVLRVGVPGMSPMPPGWEGPLASRLRSNPGIHVVLIALPFDTMSTALESGLADVIITAAPAADPRVRSTRLSALTRVGIVPESHPFASQKSVSAEEFANEPMLRDGLLPDDWMRLWWLGDVRPIDSARIVEIAARDFDDVTRRIQGGREVTVSQLDLGPPLDPSLVPVPLTGLPPTWFWSQTLASDTRPRVQQLLRWLLPSSVNAGPRDIVASAPAEG